MDLYAFINYNNLIWIVHFHVYVQKDSVTLKGLKNILSKVWINCSIS